MAEIKPFAEIIQSSLTTWMAQSWQWNDFPIFGSLVTIETKKRILFGIVFQTQTGSMDPIRYPFPYKKTEEELLQEQPQIFEFLKTTFSCLTLGYEENKSIYYQLVPEPPQIHAFVHNASESQYQQFFKSEQYLHLLFNFSGLIGNLDELLLALLKQLTLHNSLKEDHFSRFIETFSLLNGNDYRRMKLFLQRMDSLMQPAS